MAQRKVVITENPASLDDLDLGVSPIEESFDLFDSPTTAQHDPDPVTELEDEGSRAVEDFDDNEEIWEGGPVAGQIKQWKQMFGDVYVTSISYDQHIVWRVLNRGEYKQIVKKMEQLVQAGQLTSAEANMWNEETIAEMCILYPQYDKRALSGVMAGMPSLIAQEVLEASGFVALEVRQL